MTGYRTEIRIFGLLIFALLATWLLGSGLSDVAGSVLGIKFSVVGPIGGFIVLILIFNLTGLFKLELNNDEIDLLNHPIEKLSGEQLADMIDELDKQSKKLNRRMQQLEAAKNAMENNSNQEEILLASGMSPVKRPQAG